ncbi:MAG: O-antigen ligase family protein [Planctomycetaceae bacterium]|nr:O-antigen ligase family protein [Planctomycetaceae bacterium]
MIFNLRAAIMTVVGLVCFGVAIRRPHKGLLLLAILYFFRPDLWGAETWCRPTLWVTLAVLIGTLFDAGAKDAPHGRAPGEPARTGVALRWLGPILIMYFASILSGPLFGEQGMMFLQEIYKIFIVAFLIVRLCDTPAKLAAFLMAVLVGSLWYAKVCVLGWAMMGFADAVRIDTAAGQGGGSNHIAWALSVMLAPILYLVFKGQGWRRTAAIAAFGFYVVAIVATGSRGGLVCMAVAVVVTMIAMRRTLWLVAMALLLAMAIPLVSAARVERAETLTLDPAKMDASMLSRYQNMVIGTQIIADNPLFGTGLGSFPFAKRKYIRYDYAGELYHVAHNTYIQMGAELGLPFLAFFLAMNVFVLRYLLLRPRRGLSDEDQQRMDWVRISMLGALAATLVNMIKSDMARWDLFWWIYAMALAYHSVRVRYEARSAVSPAVSQAADPPQRSKSGRFQPAAEPAMTRS